VDNSASNAVYKGITLAQSGESNFLYVANLHDSAVEMYDGHFNFVRSFTDPAIVNVTAARFCTSELVSSTKATVCSASSAVGRRTISGKRVPGNGFLGWQLHPRA